MEYNYSNATILRSARRHMSSYVSINPEVLGGTPVFAGTRVPVESLFVYLKKGRTVDYFLEQFPTVERSQVEGILDEASATAVAPVAVQ